MKRVIGFNIAIAKKDQVLALVKAAIARANSDEEVAAKCAITLSALKGAYNKYEELSQRRHINLLTVDVQELNKWRDANLTKVRKDIKTQLKSPNPALRKEARLLWKITEQLGKVYRLQMDEQTGALTTYYSDILAEHRKELEDLGLVEEVEKAQQANKAFVEKLAERTELQAAFSKGASFEARQELVRAYRNFTLDLNAAVARGEGEPLPALHPLAQRRARAYEHSAEDGRRTQIGGSRPCDAHLPPP